MADFTIRNVDPNVVSYLQRVSSISETIIEETIKQILEVEEERDIQTARKAMREPGENVPWEDVKKELGLLHSA